MNHHQYSYVSHTTFIEKEALKHRNGRLEKSKYVSTHHIMYQ